jgi:hypothetical protein
MDPITLRASKRFLPVADVVAMPDPDTLQRGDRVWAEAEGVLATVVGQPGAFFYFTVSSSTPPANPSYWVSNIGSDTHTGTFASPLATIGEALRRLRITGWSGTATVNLETGVIDEGVDPEWSVPFPTSGASAVVITAGVADSGLGSVTPTGGTAGTTFGGVAPFVALPTITSAAGGAAHAYQGMFARFTGGALSGERRVITDNDGAGGFTLAGKLPAAPTAATPFVVEDLTSGIAFTGTLTILGGPLIISSVVINGNEIAVNIGNTVLETVRCKLSPGTYMTFRQSSGSQWYDGLLDDVYPVPLPAGIVECGSNWHGNSATDTIFISSPASIHSGSVSISGSYVRGTVVNMTGGDAQFAFTAGNCTLFDDSTGNVEGSGCSIALWNCVHRNPATPWHTGVWEAYQGASIMAPWGTWVAPMTTHTCIVAGDHASGYVESQDGANAGAHCLEAHRGASIRMVDACTGWTSTGAQVIVGGNAAGTTLANAFGGLTANSTDLGAASSEVCRVGP